VLWLATGFAAGFAAGCVAGFVAGWVAGCVAGFVAGCAQRCKLNKRLNRLSNVFLMSCFSWYSENMVPNSCKTNFVKFGPFYVKFRLLFTYLIGTSHFVGRFSQCLKSYLLEKLYCEIIQWRMLKRFCLLLNLCINLNILIAKGDAEISLQAEAVRPLDSIQVKAWINLLDQNSVVDKVAAVAYGQRALTLSHKIEWLPGIAIAHEKIGRIYWSIGQYPMALYHHGHALKIFKQLNYWKEYWDVMVMIGQDYANSTQYDKSLIFLKLALHKYKINNETAGVPYVLAILTWVYEAKGDYLLASQYIFEQIKSVEQSGDTFSLISAYIGLASNYIYLQKGKEVEEIIEAWLPAIQRQNYPYRQIDYFALKGSVLNLRNQFDSALFCFEKAKAIGRSISNNYSIADAFVSIGNIYFERNHYEIALANYDSAYFYFKSDNQTKELGSIAGKIGICLIKTNRLNEAKDYINAANKHIQLFDSPVAKLEYYYARYLFDSASQNWQSAFNYLRLNENLKDSLFNKTKLQQLLELQIRHETEKREELLQNEKKTISITLTILAILTLGLTAFYIQLKRNNRRIKHANEIQRTMLNEIHHRVKNNLQLISGFMQLQLIKTTDVKGRDALEESINNINVVASVHENLYNQSTDMVALDMYLEKLVHNINSFVISARQPQLHFHCDAVMLSIDQTIPLGLILNELITNSMKHAFSEQEKAAGIIEIAIMQTNKKITLNYKDNGCGFAEDSPKNNSSVGLKLLKMLVQELQGEFVMKGSNGFEFEMSFLAKGNPKLNTTVT
jgi:two-component sensor histidine kinase